MELTSKNLSVFLLETAQFILYSALKIKSKGVDRMVSIISGTTCPRCKSEAIVQLDYKTGERYVECTYCPYEKEELNAINERKEFKTNDDKDFDVVCIGKKDGTVQYSVYEPENDQEEINRFKINLAMRDTDIYKSYLVKYIHKNNAFYVTYGKIPENFLDIYNELITNP